MRWHPLGVNTFKGPSKCLVTVTIICLYVWAILTSIFAGVCIMLPRIWSVKAPQGTKLHISQESLPFFLLLVSGLYASNSDLIERIGSISSTEMLVTSCALRWLVYKWRLNKLGNRALSRNAGLAAGKPRTDVTLLGYTIWYFDSWHKDDLQWCANKLLRQFVVVIFLFFFGYIW